MKRIFLFPAFFLIFSFSLSSQLEESFDAPPLSARWTGERERFSVLSEGKLFFDGSGKEGVFSIETPLPYADRMEWEADVSLGFNPSNSNHLRLYVYATDRPSDILFYVQIGHNDDNVSLYEWRGMSEPKRVISGRKRILDAGRSSVRVRLTMEGGTRWRLYTRLPEERTFTEEGEYRLPALPDRRTAGSLRIACHCKAASKKEVFFYVDEVRVVPDRTPLPEDPDNPDNPDNSDESDDSGTDVPRPDTPEAPSEEAPVVESIEPLSLSEFQFLFDKAVYIGEAVFTISEIGQAERVGYADETKKRVNTLFPSPMEIGKEYTVSWQGVTDLAGKTVAEGSTDVVLENDEGGDDPTGQPVLPEVTEGAVRISEVMADPKGLTLLPETEYVELQNTTDVALSLKGWTFWYGEKAAVLDDVLLPAKGYVVLYRAGRACTVDPGGAGMALTDFPAQLANAGKMLRLDDPSGRTIDRISYGKAEAGRSWERAGESWHLCADPRGGTPGGPDSLSQVGPSNPDDPDDPDDPSTGPAGVPAAVGEVVFNEILPDPFVGGSEYLELYNRSSRSVSLNDLAVAVRKLSGGLAASYPLTSVPALSPGGYVALTKSREGVSAFYLVSSPDALREVKLPVLSNTGATLVLFRPSDGTVIDEVGYSSKWHAPFVKSPKGVALERIDPDRPSGEPSNWTSAAETAGYGTPGYRNSASDPSGGSEPTGIQPPEYSDLTGEYAIVYRLEQPGYLCRAWVYDLSGRRVAGIADPALLGREGRLIWKGEGTDGSKVRPGIYILYLELYHVSGHTRSYKKVFVVRG